MTKNLKGLLEEFDRSGLKCCDGACNWAYDEHEEKIKDFISQSFSLGQQSTLQEVEDKTKKL